MQGRISRLMRLKLELPARPVLSMLASDKNGSGVGIHPSIPYGIPNLSIPLMIPNLSIPFTVLDLSIPLVVQISNLTTKGATMLNSLPVRYPI